MFNKKAIVQINNNKINLLILETKDNLYYNVIDVFSDSLPLVEDIEQNGIIRPVLIKELLKILKMYRRICDNNVITEITTFTGNYFFQAKNNKSISEEIYNTCGFSLNILSQEEEMKNTFYGAVNSSDVQKGVYFYVGERACYLIHFNRRNILNYNLIPFGISDVAKILDGQQLSEEKFNTISEIFSSYLTRAEFAKNLEDGVEVLCNGEIMRAIGKIARKATKYPLDVENNYILSRDRKSVV